MPMFGSSRFLMVRMYETWKSWESFIYLHRFQVVRIKVSLAGSWPRPKQGYGLGERVGMGLSQVSMSIAFCLGIGKEFICRLSTLNYSIYVI